jgi:hypothetical protein
MPNSLIRRFVSVQSERVAQVARAARVARYLVSPLPTCSVVALVIINSF